MPCTTRSCGINFFPPAVEYFVEIFVVPASKLLATVDSFLREFWNLDTPVTRGYRIDGRPMPTSKTTTFPFLFELPNERERSAPRDPRPADVGCPYMSSIWSVRQCAARGSAGIVLEPYPKTMQTYNHEALIWLGKQPKLSKTLEQARCVSILRTARSKGKAGQRRTTTGRERMEYLPNMPDIAKGVRAKMIGTVAD